MKLLILTALLLSLSAHAADKKKTTSTSMKAKTETSGKTLDIEGKTKSEEVVDQTALVGDPSQAKMHVSCKAKDGHEIKHGEKGYEDCIKKAKTPEADVDVKFEK